MALALRATVPQRQIMETPTLASMDKHHLDLYEMRRDMPTNTPRPMPCSVGSQTSVVL